MDVPELLRALRGQSVSLATAESLTGGQLAAQITAVPGASAVYLGGVVSYATQVKIDLLGVTPALVATHGVVSAPCAEAMARGVRELVGADVAVATTGVAGPDQQEGKAVGTVYVGLADAHRATSLALNLTGTRPEIQAETCRQAVAALSGFLGLEETSVG